MAGTVLVSSSLPHRPLWASSCKLFTQEKRSFLCFSCPVSFFYLCIISLHTFFSVSRLKSVALTQTHIHNHLTLIARLTGSCFLFYVVVSWQCVSLIPHGGIMTGAVGYTHTYTGKAVCVCVCLLYYEWFANKHFSTNSRRENYLCQCCRYGPGRKQSQILIC